jgi:hypothetical protein
MANNAIVQLTKVTTVLPATNAAFAGTQVVLTDSANSVQNATLTGIETPPWSVQFANVAAGAGSVVATDVDTAGATLGTPVTVQFTELAPATFPATSAATVTSA